MAGSTFGSIFKITTWGESHGKGIGVVVDGCPAGLSLCEDDIQTYLNKRKPGQNAYSTPRNEADQVEILSGVFEGKTTGTPISMVVFNQTQRSADYSEIAGYYRPGHADYTFDEKYGFRDYRGGGRSSGRETIGRVAAGAIAIKLLEELGISVCSYTKSIGPVEIDYEKFEANEIENNPVRMPDAQAAKKATQFLDETKQEFDSAGGVIECVVTGVPAGIGEPVFDKLDANLGKAFFSIGAVKAVEIGNGTQAAYAKGTTNNDSMYYDNQQHMQKKTNHAGGILGGISDGDSIIIRSYFKPTPSIFSSQETISKSGDNICVQIKGRHDPIIVPRAVVVTEAMAALTILDLLLTSMTNRLDRIKDFFGK